MFQDDVANTDSMVEARRQENKETCNRKEEKDLKDLKK